MSSSCGACACARVRSACVRTRARVGRRQRTLVLATWFSHECTALVTQNQGQTLKQEQQIAYSYFGACQQGITPFLKSVLQWMQPTRTLKMSCLIASSGKIQNSTWPTGSHHSVPTSSSPQRTKSWPLNNCTRPRSNLRSPSQTITYKKHRTCCQLQVRQKVEK